MPHPKQQTSPRVGDQALAGGVGGWVEMKRGLGFLGSWDWAAESFGFLKPRNS